jgi:hypothetical protein
VENSASILQQTQLLISRLERLSADSIWAHRASGVRGALLRSLEKLDQAQRGDEIPLEEICQLQTALDVGFSILVKAAKELL